MAFTASVEVEVDRPAHAVWPLVVDRRLDVEWRRECIAMDLLEGDATAPGAVFREVIRFGRREVESRLRLTEVHPPKRVSFEGFEPAWLPSINTMTLEPIGENRCRITFVSEARLVGARRVAEPLMRRLFLHSLRREMPHLARYLESKV